MAYIEARTPFQQNLDYLQGSGPIPLAGGPGGGGGGGDGAFPIQQESTAAPAASGIATGPATQPQDQSRSIDAIFNPYQNKLSDLESGVQSGMADFRGQAGPSRTYGSIGGAQTLARALSDPNEQNIGQAQDLVTASYSGPTQFDPEAAQRLSVLSQDLGDFATGLRGGGLADLVQGSNPGLSQGQARQEAQFLSRDPAYQDRLRAFSGRVSSARGKLPSALGSARDLAGERQQQERGIAQASREFLQGREDTTKADLDARVESLDAANKALSSTYQDFQETGDIDALSGSGGFEADPFHSEEKQKILDAATRREEIIAQNPTFQKYADEFGDPLRLGISSHGREKFRFSSRLRESLKEDQMPQGQRRQLKRNLIGTQKQLEQEFSPHVKRVKEAGQYALQDPLYFGNSPDLPEARNYINFDPGVSPARENVSTEEQRNVINSVNEILGETERLFAAGEPVRAAAVISDVDRYLEDEKIELDKRKSTLDSSAKEWRKRVNRARQAVRKAKRLRSASNMYGLPASTGGSGDNPLRGLAAQNVSMG